MKRMYKISIILSVLSCFLFFGMLVAMSTIKIQQKYQTSYSIIKEIEKEVLIQVTVNKKIYEEFEENAQIIVYCGAERKEYQAIVHHKYLQEDNYVCEIGLQLLDENWKNSDIVELDMYQSFYDILCSKLVYADNLSEP